MNKNYTYGELYHYGVRGMRWRHRKQTTATGDPVGKTGRDIEIQGASNRDEYLRELETGGQTGEVISERKYKAPKKKTKHYYTIRRRRNPYDMKRAREKHFKELNGAKNY